MNNGFQITAWFNLEKTADEAICFNDTKVIIQDQKSDGQMVEQH
jgi:hypothetical protein